MVCPYYGILPKLAFAIFGFFVGKESHVHSH